MKTTEEMWLEHIATMKRIRTELQRHTIDRQKGNDLLEQIKAKLDSVDSNVIDVETAVQNVESAVTNNCGSSE